MKKIILQARSLTSIMLFFMFIAAHAQPRSAYVICDTVSGGRTNSVNANIVSSSPSVNAGYNVPSFFDAQWTYGGNPGETRAFYKFEDLGIPAGSFVISATLNLYADTNSTTDGIPGQPMYGSADSSYLLQVTSPWVDSTVTWNTQPTTTTAGEVFLPQSTTPTQNYLGLDITPFAQVWVDSPAQNYGIMIRIITSAYYNTMIFCSGDYPDSTLWPSLVICYNPPTGIAPVSGSGGNGMSVYPDPNNGHLFSVTVPENMDISGSAVTVHDMLGREIPLSLVEQQTGKFVLSLDDNAPSGVYIVGLKDQEQEVCRKVFISK